MDRRGDETTARDAQDVFQQLFAPQQMVTLKAGGREFFVHKHVLTRGSDYFSKCLGLSDDQPNRAFIEGHTATVSFDDDDDVDPQDLGHYLNLAYRHALTTSEDGGSQVLGRMPLGGVTPLVRTYQLCDRFLNEPLREEVQRGLRDIFGQGPAVREEPSEAHATDLDAWITDYAEGYEALDPEDGAQAGMRGELIESFCKHFPLREYGEHAGAVAGRHQFVFELSRRFSGLLHAGARGEKAPLTPPQSDARCVRRELPFISQW